MITSPAENLSAGLFFDKIFRNKEGCLKMVTRNNGNLLFRGFPLAILVFAFSCFGATGDSIQFRHNKIQISPIDMLIGSFMINYEYRFNEVHALAVEGGYTLPLLGNSAEYGGIQYRHYYSQRNFWGIFGNKGETTTLVPSTERGDTTKYSMDLSYLTIGANWGKEWYIKKRFPIVFRIGAGYPVISDIAWKNGIKHSNASIFEGFARFSAALDSELSIGVSF